MIQKLSLRALQGSFPKMHLKQRGVRREEVPQTWMSYRSHAGQLEYTNHDGGKDSFLVVVVEVIKCTVKLSALQCLLFIQ